jgi:hypothetical protein
MSGYNSSMDCFSAGSFFCSALRHCLLSTPPLQDDEVTGSWMSALIYMDAIVRADSLDYLASQWLDGHKSADISALHEISLIASKTCAELEMSVKQVAAFNKSFPSVRQSDYHDAYHFLERLLDEAKRIAQEIKETLDSQHQIKNFEVAALAVHESKSAIARMFHVRLHHKSAANLCPDSHCARFHLHSCQSSIISVWHERARDQRDRTQHLGFLRDSSDNVGMLRSCLGPLACIQKRSSTSFVSRFGRLVHATTACGRCVWVLKLLVGCNYILVQSWNHIASDCTYCNDGMSMWTAAVNFANFVILGTLE